jgi:glyoxylase-like metal-dependent hydrolase (beta-lactamase superfamily II)
LIGSATKKIVRILGCNPGLTTGPGTNTYLLTGDAPLLIDTGAGVPAYEAAFRSALAGCGLNRLEAVLVTHGHRDHVGGVEQIRLIFPEASVRKMPRPTVEPMRAFEALHDGERVMANGFAIQAVFTPGHAVDHLCYYLERERILFSGDLILGTGTTVIPVDGGDMTAYLASLRRLLDLDVREIYPGHGPVIDRPREYILAYIRHREMREEQILALLRQGVRDVPTMVKRIYADLPQGVHGLAQQSVLSHLIKLEREGIVTREEEAGVGLFKVR